MQDSSYENIKSYFMDGPLKIGNMVGENIKGIYILKITILSLNQGAYTQVQLTATSTVTLLLPLRSCFGNRLTVITSESLCTYSSLNVDFSNEEVSQEEVFE